VCPVPRLLIVHHTPSPAMQAMLEAAVAGAHDPELSGIDVAVVPALAAGVPDVLAADGFVLGTPANIGYMSGALKYFFDQVYYPCLNARPRAPYGLYVHGASDTGGAVRAVTSIAAGMGWAEAAKPVTVTGPVGQDAESQCYELSATVAANLLLQESDQVRGVDRNYSPRCVPGVRPGDPGRHTVSAGITRLILSRPGDCPTAGRPATS
jgi:hypothetical protein